MHASSAFIEQQQHASDAVNHKISTVHRVEVLFKKSTSA